MKNRAEELHNFCVEWTKVNLKYNEVQDLTSTMDENLIESFGLMKLGHTSINSLFNHSQCSNGVIAYKNANG